MLPAGNRSGAHRTRKPFHAAKGRRRVVKIATQLAVASQLAGASASTKLLQTSPMRS